MAEQMIVFVTQQLKDELKASGRVLAALDKEEVDGRHSRNALNDRDHFTQVIETLEPLVAATLSATASLPLTSMARQTGARFDMGSATPLAHQVTSCVAYLRGNATDALAAGGFSQYERHNIDLALSMLKRLNTLLLSGIVFQAVADVTELKQKSSAHLIQAADQLSELASGKTSDA